MVLSKAGYEGPYKVCKHSNTKRGTYYSVEIYAQFTFLPTLMSLKIPIKGNTRTIESGIFYQNSQDVFSSSTGNVSCLEKE